MTKKSKSNVVALGKATANEDPVAVALVEYLRGQIAHFAEGTKADGQGGPTAIAFVIVNDDGSFRYGWHSENSAAPAPYVLARLYMGAAKAFTE